jgi:uncharacterized protein
MRLNTIRKKLLFFCAIFFLASCATYYTKNFRFQEHVLDGNFKAADSFLESNKKLKKDRVKVLYHLNKGYVNRMLGNYGESVNQFIQAENMIEDYRKKLGAEALSLISNPMTKPYKVEDFEAIMVNYYQAFNFINQNRLQDALVECRRINIKLNDLNDKYPKHKNKYGRDAFAHNLMGIIYEADKDYNNAFIAYRNSYNVYKEDYATNFGISAPEQLKKDILRTAYILGFIDELEFYEKEFGIKYNHVSNEYGEAIIFWENGFGPIKSEWSINFATSTRNGVAYFDNKDLGLAFSFSTGGMGASEVAGIGGLRTMRIAFPKYIERKPICTSAQAKLGNKLYDLEIAQNINEIAFKTLHDRMIRELSNSLLRLAVKKAIEYAVRSQDENIGAIIGIINSASEKADTRNWQTLPYSVSYARIPLEKGNNEIQFTTKNNSRVVFEEYFKFEGVKGKTHFHTFHSLDSYKVQQF